MKKKKINHRLVEGMRKQWVKRKLIEAYACIAQISKEHGCMKCRVPMSCCSAEYCFIAKQYAKESWGIELQPITSGPLPFISEGNGCIVPAHLRPICSLHACQINSVGFFPNDKQATESYFILRNEIEKLEAERNQHNATI